MREQRRRVRIMQFQVIFWFFTGKNCFHNFFSIFFQIPVKKYEFSSISAHNISNFHSRYPKTPLFTQFSARKSQFFSEFRQQFELPAQYDYRQWFPMHMSVQLKKMEAKLRSVDLIIEVLHGKWNFYDFFFGKSVKSPEKRWKTEKLV